MKKMLLGAFLGMFALAGVAVLPNQASAENNWATPNADSNLLTDDQKLTGDAFLNTVQNAINWLLWILATIALVFCLYGGFLMVTSAGDEKKYEKGLGVLKYAAIGLAIIGLSWMIVSVIFWFVGTLWWGDQTKAGQLSNQSNSGSMYGSGDWSAGTQQKTNNG